MALAAPPTNDRKRVKVYELRNNDWFDRGTGFCTGQMINVGAQTFLRVALIWRKFHTNQKRHTSRCFVIVLSDLVIG